MKRKMPFMTLLLLFLFLTACSNNSDGNLISTNSLTEGSWMGYNGEAVEKEEMRMTEPIEYDASKTYEINRSSYVSFFNGDEFIETLQYSDDPPLTLDTIEEADNIIISFNQYNEDTIELKEVE